MLQIKNYHKLLYRKLEDTKKIIVDEYTIVGISEEESYYEFEVVKFLEAEPSKYIIRLWREPSNSKVNKNKDTTQYRITSNGGSDTKDIIEYDGYIGKDKIRSLEKFMKELFLFI
jgi:hypothetical protein